MSFTPEVADEAVAVMRSLVGPVRSEPGCIGTRLLHGTGKVPSLTWIEDWRDAELFEEHLRAGSFRQIVAVMELAASRPQIEIDDISSRRGFEMVEAILADRPDLRVRRGRAAETEQRMAASAARGESRDKGDQNE